MSVLILGSGQLARMMYLAGAPLGIDVQAVDVNNNKVVNPVTKTPLNIPLKRRLKKLTAFQLSLNIFQKICYKLSMPVES